MEVEVLRPIQAGNNIIIPAGSIVDASGWRTLRQLIEQRYVIPVMLAAPSERTRRAKGADA